MVRAAGVYACLGQIDVLRGEELSEHRPPAAARSRNEARTCNIQEFSLPKGWRLAYRKLHRHAGAGTLVTLSMDNESVVGLSTM